MDEYIYEVYDGGGAWSGRVLRGEIIRCRNCKRMYEIQPETNQPCSTDPNGFCSWAERSE